MKDHYDAIVVGLGAHGSAVLAHLASRRKKVIGFDRFSPPHPHGSSGGHTRLIRKAYFEHSDYVPLLLRAYELWERLEKETGRKTFHQTGLFIAGQAYDPTLVGARTSAEAHNLDIEELDANATQKRFPHFRFPKNFSSFWEKEAGFLLTDEAEQSHLEWAERCGAEIRGFEPVEKWSSTGSSVEVHTRKGKYVADSLVFTAGAWQKELLKLEELSLVVHRVPMFWFRSPKEFAHSCFAFSMPQGFFYGFPDVAGMGVKVALHKPLQVESDPTNRILDVRPGDFEPVKEFLKACIPSLDPEYIAYSVCLYTMSNDSHFIIDKHPKFQNVVLISACSGHGFKFTPVIGEIAADLVVDGVTKHPVGFLSLSR